MHACTGLFSSQLTSGNPIRVHQRAVLPLCRAYSEPITAAGEAQPRRPPPRQQPSSRTAPAPSRQYAGTAPAPSAPAPAPALRREPPSSDDVYLPRSLIMDKEVITRTSGKRLGYVNQLFVDPARLEVVSVYLRQGLTSIAASNTDHVLISSLRQIGDVVLVHDESALLDPPADETYGYIRMVGTEVQTEDGTSLGKVRDFIFNPDNGQVVSIRYDALGLPSIPQSLLSCYTLGWQDIVAVGPTKTIVRYGAERRAVKENDGWISEYVSALVNAVAGAEEEGRLSSGVGGFGAAGSEEAYRGDPAYAAWYQLHAAEYERYYGQRLPKPITAEMRAQQQQAPPPQRQRQGPPPSQQQQGRRRAQPPRQPMALPPPSSTSYTQALQPDQQWQQQQYETVGVPPPPRQQQQQQRQYVGGGAPPPPASSSGRRSTRQPPPFAPPSQQQQQQPRGPAPAARPAPPRRPTASGPPQPRSSAGAPPPQQQSRGAVEPDAVIITPPPPPQ
jgi:sporulation protein YlmC with PRC-barrel domain